jgi:hypothetical protein
MATDSRVSVLLTFRVRPPNETGPRMGSSGSSARAPVRLPRTPNQHPDATIYALKQDRRCAGAPGGPAEGKRKAASRSPRPSRTMALTDQPVSWGSPG